MQGFTRTLRVVRAVSIASVLLTGALALTACTQGGDTGSPTTPRIASASARPSTAKPVAPTPDAGAAPVTLPCSQLLTQDQVYAFNPNYGVDPNYTPTAGSLIAQVASDKGVACGWLNQSSGAVLEVAIAKPSAEELTTLKNTAVTDSNPVPTYGVPPTVEGYFALRGSSGEVQAFTGPYWIVAVCPDFAEPGDAATVMQNVLQNLPAQ